MPIAVTSEQLAIAESVGHWAKRSRTIAAVRHLEASDGRAGDTQHWAELAELGIFSVALPQDLGGAGGTVADLAAVLEQLARDLAPGPILPTLLAGIVLTESVRAGVAPSAAKELLAAIAAGDATVGVPLSPGGLTAISRPDGGLQVSGTAPLILGAGDCTHLLLAGAGDEGESWFVAPSSSCGVRTTHRKPLDFSRPLGDVVLTDLLVPSDYALPGLRTGLVQNLAAVLACAEASGVADWCCRTAADYAQTRRQFGRPIGSFQAIKHLCASMLCRAELAAGAASDAARAADEAPDELPLAAAACAAIALDAAVENAKDCIQVLGGIGFTWEHDAHLFLRRATALRQLLGGSATWRARTAELALEGMRRHLSDGESSISENELAGASAARKAAQAAAQAIALLPPERQRAALAEAGYAAPGWPAPYGRLASPAITLIIDEELASVGLSRPDLAIGNWAIPAIAEHGSPAQLERFAGPTLRGEITWCQLFSEPEAGSDLASLRSKAVRTVGGWLLTGQKVWTSLAHEADWAICLARTDPAAPKHRGITYFLVAMHSQGIEIRPLREMTGRSVFNEVFLDDVFVPDDCVVGAPGQGWRIARTTLSTERVAMVRRNGLGEDVEELLTAAKGLVGRVGNPVVIDQLGARIAEALALSAMDDQLAGAVGRGAEPGFSSAARKLLGVTHRQSLAETALSLRGVDGAAADGPGADAVHEFLLTRCLSIAGGTTQILLSLVAERVLGLPRDEAA